MSRNAVLAKRAVEPNGAPPQTKIEREEKDASGTLAHHVEASSAFSDVLRRPTMESGGAKKGRARGNKPCSPLNKNPGCNRIPTQHFP